MIEEDKKHFQPEWREEGKVERYYVMPYSFIKKMETLIWIFGILGVVLFVLIIFGLFKVVEGHYIQRLVHALEILATK